MNKLLEEAKALKIPRRNLMKNDQLEQAIKDTNLKVQGTDIWKWCYL